ncbi:MAG: hypothetical protein K6G76_01565 [Lachnospiraceae bacterium]|nr:hypothetical protein [Lachnospiraceae bacterium]
MGRITKIETKVLDFIKSNVVFVFMIGITVLSMMIRYFCRSFISEDAQYCLLPWYDQIAAYKSSQCLAEQIGDYNILYQFIIYLFTYLPIKSLYAYKIFSIIFDYALAIVVAIIVDDKNSSIKGRLQSERFVMAYSVIIMSPLVFLNSSCWAQCDAIWTFFIFAALYAFVKEKYIGMFALFGIAISFKFQAIFVLPFLLILYVREKKFSILNCLIVPLMMIVLALPGIIKGRGVLEPFLIYANQTGEYKAVSMNYPSFWNCIVCEWSGKNGDYFEFKLVAVCFTVAILGVIAVWKLKSNVKMDLFRLIFLLHVTVYTCVLFLPTMHERYGYVYEITALILAIMNKKFIVPGIGVILLSCITYGHFLFGLEYSVMLASLVNIVLYIYYMMRLYNINNAE